MVLDILKQMQFFINLEKGNTYTLSFYFKYLYRSFKIHQDKINKIKNRSIALKRENNKWAYSFDSPLKEPDTKTISLKYDTNESQIVQGNYN